MAIYCMSDIHGDYDKYKELLAKINFNDKDILYVIGDVVDRGKHPMKVLQDMMMRSNVFPIIGNHEYMALHCLTFLMKELTEKNIELFNEDYMMSLLEWLDNGGSTTIDDFKKLSLEEKYEVLDYLGEFSLYEEVRVNNKKYVLVHAGLSNFSVNRPLNDYQLYEMIFDRLDYSKVYYPDKYIVSGHTPTRAIKDNLNPDYIFKANNHIAIDCGSIYGGHLAAICLDTEEEFYV